MQMSAWVRAGVVILALPPLEVAGQGPPTEVGTIPVPGAQLPYLVEGRGRPCIVYGSTHYYPRTFSPRFKSNLRCAHVTERAFLPAAGRDGDVPFSIDQAVEDIEAARSHLGLDDIVMVGHSIHGLIALAYAAAYPEHVSHVVALGGAPEWPMDADSVAAWSDRYFDGPREAQHRRNRQRIDSLTRAHPDRRTVAEYIANGALYWRDPEFDSTPLWEGVEVNGDLLGDLFESSYSWESHRPVDVPAFVALGRYDFVVPPNVWDGVALPFPDLTVRVFDGAGHTPQLEEAAAFDDALLDWLGGAR